MFYGVGMLVESGHGKIIYEGGSRKCMVVKERMGVEELMKMVREMTGTNILKYDREMLVAVEGDSNVKVIFKGNDEHGHLYVAGNGGPTRQAQESAAVCEGRVRDYHDGKTGRKCDDGVEVGEESGNNQAGVKRNSKSLESKRGELPASRLRLRGDRIELSDDDEISVASEDAGDEETTKENDAGDEQVAEKRYDDGNKRKGSADGYDMNDNWPPRKARKEDGQAQAQDSDVEEWGGGEDRAEIAGATDLHLLVVANAQPSMLSCSSCDSKGQLIAIQEVIYNQLVHPMETHDMGIVDGKTGLVVDGKN
ncbi:hypothetical protein Cgig2_015741 [Carnegiea gigantea]|uniref:Uncharacterized protein n=1 Tax=Carnegiea gigantea TaxID=171969 RepID=A0A9Q1Q472_9CARY|nr:hypothetical protein Cgig2_015741 [Carnegiea gigantea]